MNRNLKVFVYLSSIAWLVYTLITLQNTVEAITNGIITSVVTIINMVINDFNK